MLQRLPLNHFEMHTRFWHGMAPKPLVRQEWLWKPLTFCRPGIGLGKSPICEHFKGLVTYVQCSVNSAPISDNFSNINRLQGQPRKQNQLQQQQQLAQPPEDKGTRGDKTVWIQTKSKAVFTAAIEAGVRHIVFSAGAFGEQLREEWCLVASIPSPLIRVDQQLSGDSLTDGLVFEASSWSKGPIPEADAVACVMTVCDRATMDVAARLAQAESCSTVIMNATDWKSIPAENLVAAFQGSYTKLMATAATAEAAVIALQALQGGVSGVLLQTEDALQVKELAAWLQADRQQGMTILQYDVATVTNLCQAGMGHRVAVDLCESMVPGEGLLVGSFARGLFLVHSECEDSNYINSRPFRVNAGAVHAYTSGVEGRTAYLSELSSGAIVQVADAAGRTRTAVVGRCKVETRPLLLVEATLQDGTLVSTLLQNAETVRLTGPSTTNEKGWQATPVSMLQEGISQVFVCRGDAARHTGIAITETIMEC